MSERNIFADLGESAGVVLPAKNCSPSPVHFQAPGNLRNHAKSAVRALQVLDEFATFKRPMRAVEIGNSLGLHPSSTDQLLKTMVDTGYLLFDDRRKIYFPSSRLGKFANWLSAMPLGDLDNLIDHLQNTIKERVAIAFRQGSNMQLAATKGPHDGVPEMIAPGVRFSIFNSGTGIAALCTYDNTEVMQIVERAKRYLRDRHVSTDEVLQQVVKARRIGYTVKLHEAPRRLVIAVPLISDDLPRGAAVSITSPQHKILPRIETIAETFQDIIPHWLNGRASKHRNLRKISKLPGSGHH